jgi:DNA polymerase-3 subunit delta
MIKDELMAELNSKVYPVYFFFGVEDYLIEEGIQNLLNQTLSQKERGLNLHLFNGEEHSSREIIQAAQTLPMFSRYRVIQVREADHMTEEQVAEFLKYIKKPSPTSCLILHGQTLGPWRRYRAEMEKTGKVMECPRLKGKGLLSWMKNRMAKQGKKLSEDGADYLVEVVGDHLHDLENALEKVFLYVGQKATIELSDVEGIVSNVKISTVFDLTDAIGHRNLEKALGILEKAMESKAIPFRKDEEASKKMDDPIPLLLSMMAKQYRSIWKVKEMTFRNQGAEKVADTLRMSPWHVRKLIEQGEHFSESSLREGILKCYQTDLSIKKGRLHKELLMEKLLIDLCRPDHPLSPSP